jgi:hypothetical protein
MRNNERGQNVIVWALMAYMIAATMTSASLAGSGVPYWSSVFMGVFWPVAIFTLSGE